jgi:glycosyltransferase involved in cell wall biosynthesis
MSKPYLSIIITAKDINDSKLKELLWSIRQQSFTDYEVIVETRGNSESAKGIALKKAKGDIVCIMASDNYLNDSKFFEKCLIPFEDEHIVGSFPNRYWYYKDDNILNRYFALFGVNDPVPLYLNKNDRQPYYTEESLGYPTCMFNRGYMRVKLTSVPTLGDNGMFVRRSILMRANIEEYFHIDVFQDLFDLGFKHYAVVDTSIWHRTGGNIFKFFKKRLFYASKFASDRRWHMVENRDIPQLIWFIFCTVTLIQPFYLSFKGYRVIKDKAWFLHPIVCWFTLITYGLWILKKLIVSLFKHESNS